MRSLLALLCGAASLATASSSSHLKTSGTPPTTPTAGRKDPGKVPIIDIGPLFDYDDPARAATVKEIGGACAKWGFFQVTNHGMAAEVEADFCEQVGVQTSIPYSFFRQQMKPATVCRRHRRLRLRDHRD